jgi:hypothetical protein
MKKEHKPAKAGNKKGDRSNSPAANTNTDVVPAKAQSNQTPIVDEGKPLTDEQKTLLAECVDDILKNQQGFFVVGYRLWQISSQKLHRETHKSYAAYCREKFDFSKSHANRQIQAYLCEKQLKSLKDVEVYVPTKENQVRWITDLSPEQQIEVAKVVLEKVGKKQATANDFKNAREQLYPKPKREPKTTKPKDIRDAVMASGSSKAVQFDPKLVSLLELKERAQHVYDIFSDPDKTKEALDTIVKLRKELGLWAAWQANQLEQEEAV